jgi:hypothetical protein
MNKFLLCVLLILLFSYPALAAVPVTGVTLENQSVTILLRGLGVFESVFLSATVAPASATNRRVIWNSSDEAVATVDVAGIVQGISPGTAIITVTTEDGGFTAECTVTVIESDVQIAWIRHSSSMSEVVAKTAGFSEGDFEIVDGNVVIKKSIAEAIARRLLGADDIEVVLLPWAEATFARSGQSGKIAEINYTVAGSMLGIKYPESAEGVLIKKITSPETGEFLEYVDLGVFESFADGKFWVSSYVYGIAPVDRYYRLLVRIRDGGRFDLDRTTNGLVVSQIAIVRKAVNQPQSSSGSCNVGYGSALSLLACFVLLAAKRKKL